MESSFRKNHTKILAGKDVLEQLCDECLLLGNKALIVFSENRIKQIGLYARVISLLNIRGIAHITYECLNTENLIEEQQKAVKLAKDNVAELIIAIGNDELTCFAKIIAHGFYTNVEQINENEVLESITALPIINIKSDSDENFENKNIDLHNFYAEIKPATLFTDFEY
ncbi:iron-containing alcohol dehydrogenase [Pedobacter alpinus]|uniref:Iron-containing alcohol dehydrogenase n=1 Tax=Pedobacter alpinus TaxID=1590643 RepID=A0ABW5TTB1_9SPHI